MAALFGYTSSWRVCYGCRQGRRFWFMNGNAGRKEVVPSASATRRPGVRNTAGCAAVESWSRCILRNAVGHLRQCVSLSQLTLHGPWPNLLSICSRMHEFFCSMGMSFWRCVRGGVRALSSRDVIYKRRGVSTGNLASLHVCRHADTFPCVERDSFLHEIGKFVRFSVRFIPS